MSNEGSQPGGFLRSRVGIALLVFLGVSAFLLGYEHRAHILGGYWLPGGFLLLCVLMHVFMHGGHGGHGGHDNRKRPDEKG